MLAVATRPNRSVTAANADSRVIGSSRVAPARLNASCPRVGRKPNESAKKTASNLVRSLADLTKEMHLARCRFAHRGVVHAGDARFLGNARCSHRMLEG